MNYLKLLLALMVLSGLFSSCTNEEKIIEKIEIEKKHINFSAVNLSTQSILFDEIEIKNKSLILQLNESNDTVISSKRSFNTKELFPIVFLNNNKIKVTSYSGLEIKNIRFYAEIKGVKGINEKFLLFTLDKLPAFASFVYQPEFTKEKTSYKTLSGKYVSFYQPSFSSSDFSIGIESDDAHYKKLQEITPDWNISFSNYEWSKSGKGGNWREMRAIYAQEWVRIITNLAYMFSQPEFKVIMDNYKSVMGGDLYGNGGKSDTFTKARYEKLYRDLFVPRRLVLGRTGGVAGLGGGSVLGVIHWVFYGHYFSYQMHTVGHELGHCLGFSHSSNLTYGENFGFANGMVVMYHNYLRKQNRLPYINHLDSPIFNPENQKYLEGTINPKDIVYNNQDNVVDLYFKAHPIKK